jgi:hypothetical protein
MKSKEQTLLEQAYQKVIESTYPDYVDAALANPKNFTIEIVSMDSLDWEEGPFTRNRVLIHPLNPKDHRDYSVVDNEEDAASLIDTFEEHNPEGINDKR